MQKSAEPSSRSQLLRVLARLLTAHPSWVLGHAQAYVELGLEQAQLASTAWQRRVAMLLLAAASAGLGVIFAGVGIMLWAISPDLSPRRLWVLALVPLLPLLGAGLLVAMARAVQRPPGLQGMKQQWKADMEMLRQVGTYVAPAPAGTEATSHAHQNAQNSTHNSARSSASPSDLPAQPQATP